MSRPLFVAEDITACRRLFRLVGVSWSATRYAWMSPLSWTALGLGTALASVSPEDTYRFLVVGLAYGVVLYGANTLHSVGHIVAGRVVGSPVEAILLTSTRDVVIYAQPGAAAPARCRVIRAFGGPTANLVVGSALMLAGHLEHARWVVTAGLANVCIAVWTLMPVPSMDGGVIWSALARRGGRDAASRA
jgi:hypothetical protein